MHDTYSFGREFQQSTTWCFYCLSLRFKQKLLFGAGSEFFFQAEPMCALQKIILVPIQMLRPEEIELLVCGSPTLDMKELKRVTVYDGYTADSETIKRVSLKIYILYKF